MLRTTGCCIAIVLVTLSSACNRSEKPGVQAAAVQGGPAETPSQAAPDQKALDDLRAAGSDLSKVHSIQFYLYVPSEQDAKDAARTLQDNGFNTVVKEAAKGRSWLCLGQKPMTPTIETLTQTRQLFAGLAARYHGEYDGWKAPVEP